MTGVVPSRRARNAPVRALESAWLQDLAGLPPGQPVAPGLAVTMGDLLAFHTRPADPSGATFHRGLAYGRGGPQGRPLALSVYGRTDATEQAPVVVFIHGGGWAGGDPYMHIRHAHALAARGYVTALISYRLEAEAHWPAALDDATAAVRWLRAHAATFGADPRRIAVAGGSAGGHLSAMVALTTGEAQAAVLWYPAVDITTLTPDDAAMGEILDRYFADHKAEASPVNHVTPSCPPVLTITGALDQLTTLADIERFHAALDAAGVTNELVVYEDADHAFELVGQHWHESFEAMAGFLDQHLRPQAVNTTS